MDHAKISAFWGTLVRQEASLNGAFVDLPRGVFVLGRVPLKSNFFLRSCYAQLFDLLSDSTYNTLTARAGIPWSSKWVVTGNPGIGKTFFAAYLMWRLAKEKATIVYEPPRQDCLVSANSSDRYLLLPDGTVQVRAAGTGGFEKYLKDPATWFIVDAHGAHECAARVVMVTSPRRSVFRRFLKVQDAFKAFMPVWTMEELEMCRAALFKRLPASRVAKLFSVWGGIPREVLQRVNKVYDCQREMELLGAISSSSLQMAQSSIGYISDEEDYSHLLHFHVVAPKFQTKSLRYASTHIAMLVTERILRYQRTELVSYVSAGARPFCEGDIRGYVFEGLAHVALRNGGKMRIRNLGDDNERERPLRLPKLEARYFDDVSQVDLTENRYYYPLNKHPAAVDSITSEGLFQIAVSRDHPINAKQLETLVEKLGLKDLYFVVASSLFDSFSAQPFHTDDDTVVERISPVLQSVRQWVLDLQL